MRSWTRYGFNLNLPLAQKIRDEDYRSALRIALNHIGSFGADTIVIALGLDAAISDPFEGLSITTEGFGKLQMIFPNWDSCSR